MIRWNTDLIFCTLKRSHHIVMFCIFKTMLFFPYQIWNCLVGLMSVKFFNKWFNMKECLSKSRKRGKERTDRKHAALSLVHQFQNRLSRHVLPWLLFKKQNKTHEEQDSKSHLARNDVPDSQFIKSALLKKMAANTHRSALMFGKPCFEV